MVVAEPIAGEEASRVVAPEEVLTFWREAGPDKWFKRDPAFDEEIRMRFAATYAAAKAERLADWEATANSALALVIVLDQFPRNMFRNDPRAFAADAAARAVCERALTRGFDKQVAASEQSFFYVPFMHSEALADQERCIALYKAAGNEDGLKWADLHADIIRRFGRFPHRNAVLGRTTTPDEQAFLDGGGFTG